MLNKIDNDEFKIVEKDLYIKSKNLKSEIRDFQKKTNFPSLSDLIEIDLLEGSEKALENYILDKLATALSSVEITAKENILEFEPVNIEGYKANSSSNRICTAIALSNILENTTKKFLVSGLVTNPLWTFTANLPVYLNGSTLSNIPPTTGFVQRVGIAKHSTILFLKIEQEIYLS